MTATPKVKPAIEYKPVTKADNTAFAAGPCRALLVGTAGTANLREGPDGTVLRTAVPLQQGYNPLEVWGIDTGGTAADIWALY